MKRAVRKHLTPFLSLLGLMAIGLGVAAYILTQQGVTIPFTAEEPLRIEAELPTAQAVAPGQGQIVTVSGVKVGRISGVRLDDGRARVKIEIEPEYASMIRSNATAQLRPRTVLKDMFLELTPGRPPAPAVSDGFVIPIDNTVADVNQDEILAALDADTRDHLTLLLNGGGIGLDGRGADLGEIFMRFEPTHRDIARVTAALDDRARALRSLVTSLAELNGELARQPRALTKLVNSSAVVFDAIASETPALRESVRELPETLRVSRRALASTGSFARVLGPAAVRLRPTVRALDDAGEQLRPLARLATPALRDHIRPFVREVRPLMRDLRPSALRASRAAPEMERSFVVLNHLFNMLAFDPRADAPGPFDGSGTASYLFWLAWGAHNATTLYSSQDAHNVYRAVAVGLACDTVRETINLQPQQEFLMNLTAILTSPLGCAERSGN